MTTFPMLKRSKASPNEITFDSILPPMGQISSQARKPRKIKPENFRVKLHKNTLMKENLIFTLENNGQHESTINAEDEIGNLRQQSVLEKSQAIKPRSKSNANLHSIKNSDFLKKSMALQEGSRNDSTSPDKSLVPIFIEMSRDRSSRVLSRLHEQIEKSIIEGRNKLKLEGREKQNDEEREYPLKPRLKSIGKRTLQNSVLERKSSLKKKNTMTEQNILNSSQKPSSVKLKLVDKKDIECLKTKIKLAVRILEGKMNEVFFKTEEIRMYDFIESLRIFFEGSISESEAKLLSRYLFEPRVYYEIEETDRVEKSKFIETRLRKFIGHYEIIPDNAIETFREYFQKTENSQAKSEFIERLEEIKNCESISPLEIMSIISDLKIKIDSYILVMLLCRKSLSVDRIKGSVIHEYLLASLKSKIARESKLIKISEFSK